MYFYRIFLKFSLPSLPSEEIEPELKLSKLSLIGEVTLPFSRGNPVSKASFEEAFRVIQDALLLNSKTFKSPQECYIYRAALKNTCFD